MRSLLHALYLPINLVGSKTRIGYTSRPLEPTQVLYSHDPQATIEQSDRQQKIYRRLALATICLGTCMGPIALATVNLALPAIAQDLQADAVLVSWMPTGFLLASVIAMLPMGKLADTHGRKKFFTLGIIFTGLLSLAASFVNAMQWLLFFRVLQGFSLSMIFASGLAIASSIFPAGERGSVFGIYGATIYLSLTLSPVLGGWVTEVWGWRAVFWIQAPLALSVVVAIKYFLKGEWRNAAPEAFDIKGAIIFSLWAGALVFGLAELPTIAAWITLLLTVPLMFWFISHQKRIENPLLQPSLFRSNRIFSFSLITAMLMYGASYPMAFLLSLVLQVSLGYSPIEAANVILVQTLVMAFLAPFAGKLSDRVEVRIIATCGCLIMAVGFFVLSQAIVNGATNLILISQVLMGLGFALFSTPNSNAAMGAVPETNLGEGSATVNLARTIGNTVGTSLVVLIVRLNFGENQLSLAQGGELVSVLEIWLLIAMAFALLSAVFSLRRGRMRAKYS